MNISEIKQAEAGLKGFVITGKVANIYKGKRITGTGKNGKAYDFVSTSIKLEDETDSRDISFVFLLNESYTERKKIM